MKVITIVILLAILLFILDKICLWLERRGLLYYRNKKSDVSFIGSAMQEVQSFLNPSTRHSMEAKQKVGKFKRAEEDNLSGNVKIITALQWITSLEDIHIDMPDNKFEVIQSEVKKYIVYGPARIKFTNN